VRDYWYPINEGCVPFDEVFYAGSRYKMPQSANDPDNNLESELHLQPWELHPPSARSMPPSVRNRPYEHDAGDNPEVRNSGEQPEIEIQPNQDGEEGALCAEKPQNAAKRSKMQQNAAKCRCSKTQQNAAKRSETQQNAAKRKTQQNAASKKRSEKP